MERKAFFAVLVFALSQGLLGGEWGARAAKADDALVLPQGFFRFVAASSFIQVGKEYDQGGTKRDLGEVLGTRMKETLDGFGPNPLNPASRVEASIARQDLALEYGWTDQLNISARLPVYLAASAKVIQNDDMKAGLATLNASPFTNSPGGLGELFTRLSQEGKKSGTLGDLLLGVKYQFAYSGSSPISSEAGTYRAAFALGAKLPTGQIADPSTNDISTLTSSNAKSFIVGGRTYFDYQLTKFFFVNFYTEHEYRLSGSSKFLAMPTQLTYQVLDVKYQPGFFNHLELDFVFTPELAPNLLSDSGVRLSGAFTARGKLTEVPTGYEALLARTDPSARNFSVSPYVGLFYTGAPFPVKLRVASYLSSGGANTQAIGGFSGILYAYLKF